MLKLSHISCRVDNLQEAWKIITEMGFKIEWGSNNINKNGRRIYLLISYIFYLCEKNMIKKINKKL